MESKFKVGDRVKKIIGDHERETGVVEKEADHNGFTFVRFDNGVSWWCAKGSLELVEEEPENEIQNDVFEQCHVGLDVSKSHGIYVYLCKDGETWEIKGCSDNRKISKAMVVEEQSIYDVMPDMYGKKEHKMYMFNLEMEKVNRECGEYIRSMDKIRETVRKFTGPTRDDEAVEER
jgi:hypothetical protein